MRCALINKATSRVENLIVADPAVDAAPDGCALIGDPPDFVAIGATWDGTAFTNPSDGMSTPEPVPGLEML